MNELIALGRQLWDRAEPGFFERETHRILKDRFLNLGLSVQEFDGIPGFIASSDGKARDKTVALLADMDGLPSGDGGSYGHFCGHHLQMTALYSTALRLSEGSPQILSRIAFVATPAEEYVDLDKRETLKLQGKLQRFSGKQELIERGLFESFRFVVATHAAELGVGRGVSSVLRMNGFEVFRFRFQGKSAHAGAHPHLGKNAQNSGSLFLQACAFLREEFPEDRHIRIHPVLRLRPDQAVNLVPDLVTVETYVRAVEEATVQEVADKLCRAARGCAKAIGNSVDIERIQGYAPFAADYDLHTLLRSVAASEGVEFVEEEFSAASTDMGDVSQIKPAIIVGLPGSNGRFHSPEFRVTDEQAAYVFPGEILRAYLTRLVERT